MYLKRLGLSGTRAIDLWITLPLLPGGPIYTALINTPTTYHRAAPKPSSKQTGKFSNDPLFLEILLVCCLLGFGLPFAPGCLAQPNFQNPTLITTSQGLPSNNVREIKKDKQGFIWVGTDNGLCRYDGITVEVFQHVEDDSNSICDNFILDILPDSVTGKVWVATTTGLAAFDPAVHQFKNYQHDPARSNSLPDQYLECLFKDRVGNIWIGFRENGLVRYRPESDDFQRYLCAGDVVSSDQKSCSFSVFDIQEDLVNDSILWLGSNRGLVRFNKLTSQYKKFFYERPDKKEESYANNMHCLLLHQNGKIYFGTWFYGVYVFDISTQTFSHLPSCYSAGAGPVEMQVVYSLYPASAEEIWINARGGVQRYNTRTACINFSLENDDKKGLWFGVDLIDSDGRKWCASRLNGLQIFNPLQQQYSFLTFEASEEKYNSLVTKILEDTVRHKIFAAAIDARGLFIQDQTTGKWECIPPPVDSKGILNAYDMAFLPNGDLLIIDEFLLWYKPGFQRLKRYPLQTAVPNPRLRKILCARDGICWISGYNAGLLRLDVARQQLKQIDKSALDNIWNRNVGGDYLAEDPQGNIWMREHNGLLIYLKAKDSLLFHGYNSTDIKALRGMGPIVIDPKGNVWIATRRELLGYAHTDSLEKGVLRFFSKKDGLQGEHVTGLQFYKDKLLVFTDKGMQVFDPVSKKFEKYIDSGYGLSGYSSNSLVLSTGQVATGREKCIAVFYPDSLKTNQEQPQPYISKFKVFDKTWSLSYEPSSPDTIYLSHQENFFSFEFSAVGYNLPLGTRFRYRLEGFDEAWQDGTQRRFASYTNVPGGDYRFVVEAVNNEGIVTDALSVTHVHISTVWYKTNWFWALAAVFLSGLSYLAYRWRIVQVRKEERLKSDYERRLADVEMSALRAQMNPHFIFNSLNSIEYYIINNEPEKASDYLNRFSRLIRLILQNSKSATVPIKDDLEALRLYIEMESMRFDNLFDYEVSVEKGFDLERTVIPPMLLQPYVENAIWHGLMQKKAGAGKLALTLRRSNNHLICTIEDNGIGREEARKLKSKSATSRKSFGMKITSDRLAMLNRLAGTDASVQVFDLYNSAGEGTGTRVELVIPLDRLVTEPEP